MPDQRTGRQLREGGNSDRNRGGDGNEGMQMSMRAGTGARTGAETGTKLERRVERRER